MSDTSAVNHQFITFLRVGKALSQGGIAKAWWFHVERCQHRDSVLPTCPSGASARLAGGVAAPRHSDGYDSSPRLTSKARTGSER
ncbi:hypothetical protein J2T57_002961 [Natronocella acetinitrilica]|uniref:Uncharacterized protein n=1 Tax=Natronocella acetinitrilica TaxID=414046 RepID=A0AAE3G6S4_9GAMM|nr:hypothetical protein [Natronocella acetinitrilica]